MQSMTKRRFYGSNLETLQQNFRGNEITEAILSSHISRVETLPQKTKEIGERSRQIKSQRSPDALNRKKNWTNVRFDADGFKIPQQEAPSSTTVQDYREVRSYVMRQAELIQLMEQYPRITLRLPKPPKHLRNRKIKDWVNFKKYDASHKSCRSITYVNGGTRIRIVNNQRNELNSPLRIDPDIGSHVPSLGTSRKANCSNPRVLASESNNPMEEPTAALKGDSNPRLSAIESNNPIEEPTATLRDDSNLSLSASESNNLIDTESTTLRGDSNPSLSAPESINQMEEPTATLRGDSNLSLSLSAPESNNPIDAPSRTSRGDTNPRLSASESNNPIAEPTSTSKCYYLRSNAKAIPTASCSKMSTFQPSKSYEAHTEKLLEEADAKDDAVDEPASLGLELIRLNYEDSTTNQENDLKNMDTDHASPKMCTCEDQYAIPKVKSSGRSRSDTIGKLSHCFVSLKRIDESGPLEPGLQLVGRAHQKLMQISDRIPRNSQKMPCSAIIDPLQKNARSIRHYAGCNKVCFPKDYKRHYGKKCRFQEHGNSLKNLIKPCYVKLKRLDSGLAIDSGTKIPLTGENSPTGLYGVSAVKECSVKLRRMEVECSNKSGTTSFGQLQSVHMSSDMCSQILKEQIIWKEQDWSTWEPDLKRCSVLMERLD